MAGQPVEMKVNVPNDDFWFNELEFVRCYVTAALRRFLELCGEVAEIWSGLELD